MVVLGVEYRCRYWRTYKRIFIVYWKLGRVYNILTLFFM